MKRVVCGCCIAALLAGCVDNSSPHAAGGSSPPPAPPPVPAIPAPPAPDSAQRVIAHLNGQPIVLGQIVDPLVESHGLNILFGIVWVQMARDEATQAGVAVTDADFQAAREAKLASMFKDADQKAQDQLDHAEQINDTATADRIRTEMNREHEELLDQLLKRQNLSRVEFDMDIKIDTYLRKIVEPQVNKAITEESLHAAFNQLYGETVQVRVIALANQSELAEAQRRLARGEKFEDVAAEMSHDKLSASLGGELPRFSREAPGYPANFKDVAFTLQPGQVSDSVEANGMIYLIKMDNRFAPRAVKYELVRDAVRRQLFEAALQSGVAHEREALAQRVALGLKIDDPVLAKQRQQAAQTIDEQEMQRQKIREDLARQRSATPDGATPPPADQPPATPPATGQ